MIGKIKGRPTTPLFDAHEEYTHYTHFVFFSDFLLLLLPLPFFLLPMELPHAPSVDAHAMCVCLAKLQSRGDCSPLTPPNYLSEHFVLIRNYMHSSKLRRRNIAHVAHLMIHVDGCV